MRAKSANPKDCAAPFLSPAVVNLRWYYYIILHYDEETYLKKCYQTNLSPMKVFFDINDLIYFHKIINNQIPLNIPKYIQPYTVTK